MIVLNPLHTASLLESHPVLLLSTRKERRNNLAPVIWYSVSGGSLPLLEITLKPSTMSFRYLRESGDFVAAVCKEDMARDVHFCGVNSDRSMEKMRFLNIPAKWGNAASPLILPAALANLECRVRDIHQKKDGCWLIAGEVISALVDSDHYENGWKDDAPLLHYEGGNIYRTSTKTLDLSDIRPGNISSEWY